MAVVDSHCHRHSTEETVELVRSARADGAGVVFIVGPTASGKSALALAVAKALDGEIVCADSQQVYRGMDIGTAKPTNDERGSVPHHMFDLADPSEQFTVASYVEHARPCVDSLVQARKLPVVVGGTGLYIHALAFGYALDGGGEDAALRAELLARPLASLVSELERVDPTAHAAVDRMNPRRVIRALERARGGGVVRPQTAPPAWKPYILGISMEPSILRQRIRERVGGMFQRGFLGEAQMLLAKYGPNAPGLQALGYRDCIAVLLGDAPREGLEERIALRTMQYAKRQRTWFRKTPGLRWIEPDASAPR